jgi:hypothetical protein
MLIIPNHSSDKGIAGQTRNDGAGEMFNFRTLFSKIQKKSALYTLYSFSLKKTQKIPFIFSF